MPVSWVDIDVGGDTMEAYLTNSGSGEPSPAVIVIQEIWGVNSHIQYVTDRLPSLGYVGLAPAMFHRQGRMTMGLHEEFDGAIASMQQCSDSGIIADVQAAADYLKAQPFVQSDRIGTLDSASAAGSLTWPLARSLTSRLPWSITAEGSRTPWAATAPPPSTRPATSRLRCLGYSVKKTAIPARRTFPTSTRP